MIAHTDNNSRVSQRKARRTATRLSHPLHERAWFDLLLVHSRLVHLDRFVVAERRARNRGDAVGSTCRARRREAERWLGLPWWEAVHRGEPLLTNR
jgi:hypothetical protein